MASHHDGGKGRNEGVQIDKKGGDAEPGKGRPAPKKSQLRKNVDALHNEIEKPKLAGVVALQWEQPNNFNEFEIQVKSSFAKKHPINGLFVITGEEVVVEMPQESAQDVLDWVKSIAVARMMDALVQEKKLRVENRVMYYELYDNLSP
jgi:hypothetical protein